MQVLTGSGRFRASSDLLELDFFLVASPYTLADQPVLDAEFPACSARGVGVIIGQVFASGILATGPVPGARHNYAPASPETVEQIGHIGAAGTACLSPQRRCSSRYSSGCLSDPRCVRAGTGDPQRCDDGVRNP